MSSRSKPQSCEYNHRMIVWFSPMASCPVCALSAIIDGLDAENAALKADRLSLAVSVKHPVHKYMKWCDCVQCGTARRVIAEAESQKEESDAEVEGS